MGRDSILDMSISLSEKQARLLYSAPALFGNVNTRDVFEGIFLFRYCVTPRRPRRRKRVKLESSSSIPSSLHSRPNVTPARLDAMAAVLSGVHPSGIPRVPPPPPPTTPSPPPPPFRQSRIILALPAVSYVGLGTIPLLLR